MKTVVTIKPKYNTGAPRIVYRKMKMPVEREYGLAWKQIREVAHVYTNEIINY